MTELLFEFDTNQDPPRVSVNSAVFDAIQVNFSSCHNVCPVVSVGNSLCGRGEILETISGSSGVQGADFASAGRMGVLVFTKPVPIGQVNLLLIKMWGVDSAEMQEEESVAKKAIASLLAVSSVCLLCTEKSACSRYLAALLELHSHLKGQLGLSMSEIVVFLPTEETLKRRSLASSLASLQQRASCAVDFLFRGAEHVSEECAARLMAILADLASHKPFLHSHEKTAAALQASSEISALTTILRILFLQVNSGGDASDFIRSTPRFSDSSAHSHIAHAHDRERRAELAVTGSAVNFFKLSANSYRMDLAVVGLLQMRYDLSKPVIVLPVFGKQGKGKSTFLNSAIQYLTRSRKSVDYFAVGNTGDHTTKECQLFSQPLPLGGHQLMLVDVEGLEGLETQDERLAVLQDNLVSALLTLCSAPCFIVNANEIDSKEFVRRHVTRISSLARTFKYSIQRIHVLMHDVDLDAAPNLEFIRLVEHLNDSLFCGGEVLRILHKPNCLLKKKDTTIFLKVLFEDSQFPKTRCSGEAVGLEDLLMELRNIMEHSDKHVETLRLSTSEVARRDGLIDRYMERVQAIRNNSKAQQSVPSAVGAFNQLYEQAHSDIFRSLSSETVNLQRLVWLRIENRVELHRKELTSLQFCYEAVKDKSVQQLSKEVGLILDHFYRDAWWLWGFLACAKELKKKLAGVHAHFPSQSDKLSFVLSEFEGKRKNLRNWFIANYSFQVATTAFSAATAGVLLAAGALPEVIAAGRVFVSTVSAVNTAVGVGNFAFAEKLGYGAGTTLVLTETAKELFAIKEHVKLAENLANLKGSLSKRIATRVKKWLGSPQLQTEDISLTSLLVIGHKDMKIGKMLSEFVKQVAPFTPESLCIFKETPYVQVAFVGHGLHRDRLCALMYLRIETDSEKPAAALTRKLAAALLSRVSLTCLLVDDPQVYADSVLSEAVRCRERWKGEPVRRCTAVALKAYFHPLFSDVMAVHSFDEASIEPVIGYLKSQLDVSSETTHFEFFWALKEAEAMANSM